MIKYATENPDGQLEQHLKVLTFNHNFNFKTYNVHKQESSRVEQSRLHASKLDKEDKNENENMTKEKKI